MESLSGAMNFPKRNTLVGGGLSARIRVHLYPVQSKHNYRVRGMKSRVFLDVPETGVRITVFTFDLNLISLFSLEILVIIKHYAE